MKLLENWLKKSGKIIFRLEGKYALIGFRFTILLFLIFLLLYGQKGILKNEQIDAVVLTGIVILCLIEAGTNLSFVFLRRRFFRRKILFTIFLFDIAVISLAHYWAQGFDSDLFMIYFLLILASAIFKKPLWTFLAAGLACLLYASIFLAASDIAQILQPSYLIRFPLLLIVAFFSSIVVGEIETERVQLESETKNLQEQLIQSQKMEAVGRLAGGIAHDFNNLLTVINGYCALLLENRENIGIAEGDLEKIKKAGDRATALTRQLLAFSRKQIVSPVVLNLNEIVSSLEPMIRRLIEEDISLVLKTGLSLKNIKVDSSQIEQVIMNLVVNARDAMPRGGNLTIETADRILNESDSTKDFELDGGSYVMLSVTDTGTGIDSDTLKHIFEPFFTTKEQGKGTGLGLSTVYGIVKHYCGAIHVESHIEQGTAFLIYFPATEELLSRMETKEKPTRSLRGSETILVVEDEELVRRLTLRILKKYGYIVIEAQNGREALSIFEERRGKIDLLLTDTVMPEMSGRELSDHLKSKNPSLKFILMSGYTDDIIVRYGVMQSQIRFIEKPFKPEVLLLKVRQTLDEKIETPELSPIIR